jgi:hypothetical protein
MSLKDQMAFDAKTVFLNNGEFAEEITYKPAGGAAKLIQAVIVRKELLPSDEVNGRSLKNQAEVYISTDPLEGVSFINRRDDRITMDVEGTAKDARINDVLGKDNGMWRLLVGW